MNKYICITNGTFEFCTGCKTTSEKKAQKKAVNELTKKAHESDIGMITEKIGFIKIPDDHEIVELMKNEGVPDIKMLVNIKGKFSYSTKLKAKNPEKARDKFIKKIKKEFTKQEILFKSNHVKVIHFEDSQENAEI